MKKLTFYFLALTVLASCKKPDACINASPTTVKVGQDVTFIDCSVDAKVTKIDFGDGSKEKEMTSTKIYAYGNPGTFTAKLQVYSKNENKKLDFATTSITVEKPTAAELHGTWNLYKAEEMVWGVSTSYPRTEKWIFYSDGELDKDGNPSTWSLANNNLSASSQNYRIIKLYDNELVVRYKEISFFGNIYSAYYFSKQ